MACIRKRRGKFVVDYRDALGVRRWVTCDTKREADDMLASKLRESRQAVRPTVNIDLTTAAYAERWLALTAPTVKPRTLQSYSQMLRIHLLPAFGSTRVRQVHKSWIRSFLAEKLTSGLAPNSVRIMHATLRAMLNSAVEDGVLLSNPAEKLGRRLRLNLSGLRRDEQVKAMTREQLAHFLDTTARTQPEMYPFFMMLARTGLRLGEAFALRWDDVDFDGRAIHVTKALSAGRIETPKSGKERTVDMSRGLLSVLQIHRLERQANALEVDGEPGLVFATGSGAPLDQSRVGKILKRALKAAGLSQHFTPHCLRHTFASLLLQQGESLVYVQRQLGHASIQLTVDTYGKWLPMGNKAAVDKLDVKDPARITPLAQDLEPPQIAIRSIPDIERG